MTEQRAQGRRGRRLTWLAVLIGILRTRRFQDNVAVGAVLVAALAGMGRETQTHSVDRFRGWIRKLDARAEHAIKAGERVATDAARKTAARHG